MNDIYRSYYTQSEPIVNTMLSDLPLRSDSDRKLRVLEPCGGDGAFVEGMLNICPDNALEVDVYEIDPAAISTLQDRFESNHGVHIHSSDTLLDEHLDLLADTGGYYDCVIGNPPYGGWQDYEKRALLKRKFDGLYAKETYSLFLKRSIDLVRPGGYVSFIIPDTFLNLHRHAGLRKEILRSCMIQQIRLFPSSFFPDVNFGYSGLCIITLVKENSEAACLKNQFAVETEYPSVDELTSGGGRSRYIFTQEEVLANPDSALLISPSSEVTLLIKSASSRVGDMASCVTGIYTGSNLKYLRPASHSLRGASRYEVIDADTVFNGDLEQSRDIDGIAGPRHYIPIVKGGARHYFKPTEWFIDWSTSAVEAYRSNKKARFQNAWTYFMDGVGIPMVTSSRISASRLDGRIFDQSIVGVFPKDNSMINYLLALFNSEVISELVRTINPTANNSANYIKKVPIVVPPDSILREIDSLINYIMPSLKKGCKLSNLNHATADIERIVREAYNCFVED